MTENTGVIVVDLQADFSQAASGSLAVAGTDRGYVDEVHQAVRDYVSRGMLVYATQDWHPADHCSFANNHPGGEAYEVIEIDGRTQVLWPEHCVRNLPGARLLLPRELFRAVIPKGVDPHDESYSGFQDEGGHPTELLGVLKRDEIGRLIIFGLATDYCVKATVADALSHGFSVEVPLWLCRGVAPDTSEAALEEMRAAGALLLEAPR